MANEIADEERQLLQIFSNEVWGLILENVKEVKDYHKICAASSQLRVCFLRQAPLILFQDVAKAFLIKNAYINHFPPLVQMRQVCRTWRKEVDKLLQKTPDYFVQRDDERLHQMRGIAFVQNENSSGLHSPFSFGSEQRFAKFEEHFDQIYLASSTNPFVQRKIDLYIDDENGLPEAYYAACTRFLEKYGKHVWFCIIVYEFEQRNNKLDFYNRGLSAIPELMPNLRALQIFPLRNLEDGDDLENEAAPVEFPTLPHLEYISLNSIPCAVVEGVLERNPQVRYIDGAGFNWMCIFLQFLPNLLAATFQIEDEDSLHDIDHAGFTNRRLERLWLRLVSLGSKTGQAFQMLERHFSKTLVELHLNLTKYSKITAGYGLLLPHLKILHMEMNAPKKLDFLLPIKETMEELYLATEQKPSFPRNCRFEILKPEQDEGSKLQVFKFWKEPQKSNVWSFFPKLRVLEIKWFKGNGGMPEKHRCTRNEWQAEMKAKGN